MKSKLLRLFPIIAVRRGALRLGAMPAQAAKIRVVTTLTDLADFTRARRRRPGRGEQPRHRRRRHARRADEAELRADDEPGRPAGPGRVRLRARLPARAAGGQQESAHPAGQARLRGLLEGDHTAWTCPSRPITPRGTCIPMATRTTCSIRCWRRRPSTTSTTRWWRSPRSTRRTSRRNRDAYLAKLNAKIAEWEKETRPLKGTKFVSYHEHWPYFAERFGMKYYRHHRAEAGDRSDPAPYRGTGHRDEGRPCPHRGARAAVPGKGAQAHRRTDRRHPGNPAHHARGRAEYGDVHRDDGLHHPHDGCGRTGKKIERRRSGSARQSRADPHNRL